VLQNAICVEVVHVSILLEVLIYCLHFSHVDWFLYPRWARLGELTPE
jgi:hypothetical protein